jgi:molybdopterin synthase sulfur carrier subunit
VTTVRIPQPMQVYTRDREVVQGQGKNVRALLNDLEQHYPGLKAALLNGEKLKPGIAIMLDGEISQFGLLQPVNPDSEVVFIPAIGGG